MKIRHLSRPSTALCGAIAAVTCTSLTVAPVSPAAAQAQQNSSGPQPRTPIEHVIMIIGENRTFDHVFATYTPRSRRDGEQPALRRHRQSRRHTRSELRQGSAEFRRPTPRPTAEPARPDALHHAAAGDDRWRAHRRQRRESAALRDPGRGDRRDQSDQRRPAGRRLQVC